MNTSNPFEAAPAPATPFTAIVYLYRVNTDYSDSGEESCTVETVDALECGAFDARDAWRMAQDALEALNPEEGIEAYIAGVCGGTGWERRPAWIPVWSVMTPAQRDEQQNAALDSVCARDTMERVTAEAARH